MANGVNFTNSIIKDEYYSMQTGTAS